MFLKLSITPREMHTIYAMHYIQKYSNFKDEIKSVRKLESMKSDLSQDRIIYYLQSPRYSVKMYALRALYGSHLKPETVKAVFRELKYGEYTTAYFAAVLLADHKDKKVIPMLRKYLNSKDTHLVSTCMLGLVNLQDKKSYPRIIQIFKQSRIAQILIHGAAALANMDDINMLKILLDKFVDIINRLNNSIIKIKENKHPGYREHIRTMYIRRTSVNNEIICSAAHLAGCGDEFYKFLRIYDNNRQTGILYFKRKAVL